MAVHTGRLRHEEGAERARGGTRLDDWADARWVLTRQTTARFFFAEGRDIYQKETQLRYQDDPRRLILGEGSRREHQLDEATRKVEEVVAQRPGITKSDLRKAVGGKHDQADTAIAAAVESGGVRQEQKGRRLEHFPGDPSRFRVRTPEAPDGSEEK